MMNIRLATENRKGAALRLAELTGETSRYTRVPRCAYQVGPFFFEKDGTVTVPEDADLQPLRTLAEEGLIEPFDEPEADAAPETALEANTTAENAPEGEATCLTISLNAFIGTMCVNYNDYFAKKRGGQSVYQAYCIIWFRFVFYI